MGFGIMNARILPAMGRFTPCSDMPHMKRDCSCGILKIAFLNLVAMCLEPDRSVLRREKEHSRVPKGNGIRRIEALENLMVTTVVMALIIFDDITLVGAADDAALVPMTTLWWDYALMVLE